MNETIGAFLVGSGWGIAVFVYSAFSDTGVIPRYERSIRSAMRIGFDVVFIGGGTGVVMFLVESSLSAFRYGLVGMVFAVVAATIVAKFR